MERRAIKHTGVAGVSRLHECIFPLRNIDDDNWLTSSQKDSLRGVIDIYEPIEAYAERWSHCVDQRGEYVSAEPVAGTRERRDLPPLTSQWKADAKRRFGGNNG